MPEYTATVIGFVETKEEIAEIVQKTATYAQGLTGVKIAHVIELGAPTHVVYNSDEPTVPPVLEAEGETSERATS